MHLLGVILASAHFPFSDSPSILCKAFHLKCFSFFKRGTVKEFCVFGCRTAAAKTEPGTKCSVRQDQLMTHCYHTSDGLVAAAITDAEYPSRAVFFVLRQAIERFRERHGDTWKREGVRKDEEFRLPELKNLVKEHQDPREFDALIRAASATDSVLEVMNANMQAALARGEQLDELVYKSEDLSLKAKMFYKESKTKMCCNLL